MSITFLNLCFSRAAGLLGLAIRVWPLTSEGNNFFVRTSFRVFLDSIESPLSKYSIHVILENSR